MFQRFIFYFLLFIYIIFYFDLQWATLIGLSSKTLQIQLSHPQKKIKKRNDMFLHYFT
jgi:hypothetical protein